jgi:hypothetical protein
MDRDLDVGDGLAAEICSEHFSMAEDGLACVTDKLGRVLGLGIDGLVVIEPLLEDAVVEAAEYQAAENIYLHYVRTGDDGEVTHLWNVDQNSWEPWTVQPSYPDIAVSRLVRSDTPSA